MKYSVVDRALFATMTAQQQQQYRSRTRRAGSGRRAKTGTPGGKKEVGSTAFSLSVMMEVSFLCLLEVRQIKRASKD